MRTAHFRGNAWQKCDFAALYYTLLRVQRHAADFAALYYTLIRVQRHAADFAALYYILLCKYSEEISRKDEQVISRFD